MADEFGKTYLEQIEDRVFKDAAGLTAGGAKIAGLYCAFTPKELVAAAGVIPVSLCAGTQEKIPDAEAFLPPNLCPLIKSSFGNAVTDTCPYFHMTDFLLADATCDGKKKMFEILSGFRPLTLLHLPQTAQGSLGIWLQELVSLKGYLEKVAGTPVTTASLGQQIRLYNRFRQTVLRVYQMNRADVPAFTGFELVCVTSSGGFECCLDQRIMEMEAAMARAAVRRQTPAHQARMAGRPRILLTGCPTTHKKILHLVEDCGGVVVALETCGGLKTAGAMVEGTGDLLLNLARRYLDTPCACMSPNPARAALIRTLVREFRIQGVLDLTWNGCHTYNIESHWIEKAVTERLNLPYLHVLTDYSENDTGQLTTRIGAFLEIISGR